ncbi:hypothetical protein [Candidatus Contubernalis alkaliaceticus]|uniref:hypothetical protein n=1 Tax=Candidatus Contubernalis alkaliaceticus TaxID=338645 RepID=UPI001F4C4B71|nr:hypothetical protein [Candidatus Contubernalis alkalaceticus]
MACSYSSSKRYFSARASLSSMAFFVPVVTEFLEARSTRGMMIRAAMIMNTGLIFELLVCISWETRVSLVSSSETRFPQLAQNLSLASKLLPQEEQNFCKILKTPF